MTTNNQTRLLRELDWRSYMLSHWTIKTFLVAPVVLMCAVVVGLLALVAGAWIVDLGNHFFGGSGTLALTDKAFSTLKMVEAELVERRGLMLISVLASFAVALTLEKGPLVRVAASIGCIAVHLVVIGALL